VTLWPDAGHSVTPVEGDIPSFKEGSRADLKMQRYLIVIGAAWGGQTTDMTSPSSPWLSAAVRNYGERIRAAGTAERCRECSRGGG